MPTRPELLEAINQVTQRILRINDKISEIDLQIKNTSVNNVDRIEAELSELRNSFYEIQARELLGEFDPQQRREVEERILATEKRLKTESGALQDLVGVRHALDAEFKKTQALDVQYQAALERLEYDDIKQTRQNLVKEIEEFRAQLEDLFTRVSDYNMAAINIASRILKREYQQKGFPEGYKPNGIKSDPVHHLAQPFDINQVKNSLTETLSDIFSRKISS